MSLAIPAEATFTVAQALRDGGHGPAHRRERRRRSRADQQCTATDASHGTSVSVPADAHIATL